MSSSIKSEASLPYLEFNPGGKSKLVLVHGVTGSHYLLRDIGKSLAKNYHVIIPSLPGHAGQKPLNTRHNPDSYAKWLDEFCQKHMSSDESITLVGHSYGSLIVLTALKYSRFNSAVIVTPPIASLFHDFVNGVYSGFGSLLPRSLQRKYLYMFTPWFVAPSLIANKSTGNLKIIQDTCRAENALINPRAVIEAMLSVPSSVKSLSKKTYPKPAAVISAQNDIIAPIGLSKKIWHANPSMIDKQIVNSAGHQIFVDSPKAIERTLTKAIRKVIENR